MYSVFYKDETNGELDYRFRGLLQNDKKDIFFKNAALNLGWDISKAKVYEYANADKIKFQNFVNHMSDEQSKNIIWCNPVNGVLNKAVITKDKNIYLGNVLPNVSYGEKYYTQDEINQFNANEAAVEQWHLDNPNPDENTPEVVLPHPDWTAYEGEIVVNEQEHEVIDSINGTLFDIPARIILEEAALADGKKKLD